MFSRTFHITRQLTRPQPLARRLALLALAAVLSEGHAQSIRKLERRAINRTHLTFVNGDTVQRFTVTYAHPAPRAGRFYYWQGPTHILRTAGAYDGRLLDGAYQLTNRNGNLLGNGNFTKGLKTGRWRTWRPDGTPLTSSRWQQGRQRGRTRRYDEQGQLLPVAPPPTPAGTAAPLRAWQPAYWRRALQRLKQWRATRHLARPKSAPPVNESHAVPGRSPQPASTPVPSPRPGS